MTLVGDSPKRNASFLKELEHLILKPFLLTIALSNNEINKPPSDKS